MALTKSDLAKYPFLKEATEYVKELNLNVEDLTNPEFVKVLERAEERLEEAILYALVSRKPQNEGIEILSFPVAIMIAIATENPFIKKRYALAEAKQSYNDLKLEPKEKILAVAQNFGWDITMSDNSAMPYEFALSFKDYLKNIAGIQEKRWKLVNRLLVRGRVYLTKSEVARLLSEEVRNYIEKRLEVEDVPKLPPKITEAAGRIKGLSIKKVSKGEIEAFPKTVMLEAFPPCIKALYETASSGRHIPHVGRFTLTSFLINVGMSLGDVNELFKSFSDYNERVTRYQIEHIAGERGSRTRYIPPKCDTLRTYGICMNPEELCQKVRHPLSYYRRRIEALTLKRTYVDRRQVLRKLIRSVEKD